MKSKMKRLGKLTGTTLLILSLTLQTMAQDKHAFSARECVDYAALNNVQVKNALLGIKIQEQTNREYTSAALPKLTGSINVNYFPQVAVQSFPNFIAAATYGVLEQEGVKDGSGNPIKSPSDFGYVNAAFGTKFNSTAGVQLDQLLFDGQVFVGLQARDAALQYATKTAEVTEEQIRANIYKVYFQLVVGKKQVESIDANIDRFEKLLHDTKEIYKNGFAEKLDVDKVEVTLTNLKTEKVKVEYDLDAGLMGLKVLMGMPVKDTLVLSDTLSEERLKGDLLNDPYTYSDRKEFQALELAQKLGEFNVKRYKFSFIPTISLIASYNELAYRNQFNFLNFNEDWFASSQIGVRLNVPIFEGFAKDARIKRAQFELEQTRNSMDDLKRSIDHEVEQARLRLTSALAAMDFQGRNRELAEAVFEQTKLKYDQGLGSNQEITTAQTEFKTAETNYFNAVYNAIIAKVDYLKAIGKLQ